MKQWLVILCVVAAMTGACNKSAMPREERAAVSQSVTAQRYTFEATSANPSGGAGIQLTPGYYDLVVTPSAITATLPYYGRAYSAPLDPSQGGLRFTSSRFRYTSTPASKGGWEIIIIPEDIPEVRELRLGISPDGYATLHVTSTNRQPIGFYGQVKNTAATP